MNNQALATTEINTNCYANGLLIRREIKPPQRVSKQYFIGQGCHYG